LAKKKKRIENMIRTPKEITKNLYDKGVSFLNEPNKEILAAAIIAGTFVSMAAVTSITVCAGMSDYFGAGFTKLIFGIVFTLGMIMLSFSGSQLFTGVHMNIAPVYDDNSLVGKLLSKWGIVFIGNFIGSLIMVGLILMTGAFKNETMSTYMVKIVEGKLNLTFMEAFVRGIFCNFLVCLSVRVGEASDQVSGRMMGYIYVIGAFVINSFEHSVANMFFIPMGIILGGAQGVALSWSDFFIRNLLPVTLGNIIGGAFFVSTFYYFLHRKYIDRKIETNKVGVYEYGDFKN
jgi:formate/nitrite transporter